MTPTATTASRRLLFLDWLRIAAFALLIVYHVGMYYVSWDWHVKSAQALPAIEPLMLLSSPWRLALLFLIAGAATSMMLLRSGGCGFVRTRSSRLLWPLFAGVLIIVPPQSYFEVVHKFGYDGGYLAFLRLYLSADGSFCRDNRCLILPTWNHLWFVAYLWAYTVTLWMLLRAWPDLLDRCAARIDAALAGGRIIWVPLAVLAALRIGLADRFPTTGALIDDWANHAIYFSVFVAGAVFARAPGIWSRFEALRWRALSIALLGWLAMLSFRYGMWSALLSADLVRAGQRAAFAAAQWGAIVAALGFAHRWLDFDHRLRAPLSEAVFPLYIVHQTLIIAMAAALRPLQWPAALEAPILVAATFAIGFGIYGVVRRSEWLRPAFGLAPYTAPSSVSPSAAARLSPRGS